jgi:serine/threonine protein phosphatase PrpC
MLSLMWLLSWALVIWVSVTLLWPHKRDARHVAWREARSLSIYSHTQPLHEDMFEEDAVMNVPKLRLPHRHESGIHNESGIHQGVIHQTPTRSIPVSKHTTPRSLREIRASKELERATYNDVSPDLIAVGQTQRRRSTTPLPYLGSAQVAPQTAYTWQREQKSRAIEEIPTTPERPSRAGTVGTLMRTKTKLEVGVGWNSGIARKQQPNEDSLVVLQGTCTYNDRLVPFGLFVVADGMGGHDFGQEASRIAIQNMMQVILHDIVASDSLNDTILVDLLVNAVEQANTAICNRCREWGRDMGTTLTAALIVDIKAYVVNVGDSRTYLYDDASGLTQITRDHSLVANLVMAGDITPDEVYTHPERNKVYRSLGNKEGVEVDWFTRELRRGDTLLLCSDGLWEMVRDPDIRLLLSSLQEPTRISEMLVHAALRGGGADNVSVIVVRVA